MPPRASLRWLPENYRQTLSSDTWQFPISKEGRFPKRRDSNKSINQWIHKHPWWASPTLPWSSDRRISSHRRRAHRACRPARATNLGEEDKRQTEENCRRFRHHHGRWIAFADAKKSCWLYAGQDSAFYQPQDVIYSIVQSSMLRWSSEKLTPTFTTFRPSSAKALA